MKNLNQKTSLQIIIMVAIALFTVSAYFAFGFFFDVFVEIIPILLLPLIIAPLIFKSKNQLRKSVVIAAVIPLMLLSIAASTAVGVVATSIPAYGIKPICGTEQTLQYSRSFMKKNYEINQKTVVRIWLPENYSDQKKYPVIYLLDGDMYFDYAALKASEYCKNSNRDIIVVGIGYGYWNATFARGGIVWQDSKHVRGRWRDFCFADDTQPGYMPGTVFGGESKRGEQFARFVTESVVKDIRSKFSTDELNSTIYGHSLGGGLAAYFFTQYNPALENNCAFTNFVIVDNGYLDYYNKHFSDLQTAMSENGYSAFSEINVYRIWGGDVNPVDNSEQFELYKKIDAQNWNNVNNYFWLPEGANHSDTQTIGIDNALLLAFGMEFGCQTVLD